MEQTKLATYPDPVPPKTRIFDFREGNRWCRVLLTLVDSVPGDDGQNFYIRSKAYEMDADGLPVLSPMGTPSSSPTNNHTVNRSGMVAADPTHTLKPGWVFIVGDYDEDNFEKTAEFGHGRPTEEPTLESNTAMQYYDLDSGKGYRWVRGLQEDIAESRAKELFNIAANSQVLAGLDF